MVPVPPLAEIIQLLLVVCGMLLLAGRRVRSLVWPVVLAGAGAALPIMLLLARGPDDWAGMSSSLRLYGSPVLVLRGALGLALLALTRPHVRLGRERPSGEVVL